jgi:putative peptidoglycan lipid II flippase
MDDEPIPADTSQAFVRHSAVMSVGTALSRLTGFLRVAAMAFALGIGESRLADAYNVANTTPNIVYELALGGILSSVFVPVFVEWLQTRGRDQAMRTANTVMTVTSVALGAVAVLGILLSGLIIRLYTVAVPDAERPAVEALASFFLRWFMPQIVFYGIGAVATGLLNAHRRFAPPMFAPILNNLVVIATFLTFAILPQAAPGTPAPETITDLQKLVLAVGTTLGVVAMTVALFPALRKIGYRWRWRFDLADEGLRRIGRLGGWVLVYVMVNQLGYLVIIVLAQKAAGGYTAYLAAFIFLQLPHAIFSVSIMTALLPAMSSRWAASDSGGFRDQLSLGVRATALVVLPSAAGYIALATPIVRLLLEHGVTGAGSTALVAGMLQLFAIGLFAFSTFQLFLRAFYAMQDTRTPALVNIVAVAINTAANVLFVRYLGVKGLALGHATAYTFAAIASGVILRGRLHGIDGRRILRSAVRILVASIATGFAAWGTSLASASLAGTSALAGQVLQVSTSLLVGVLVFVAVASALHVEELSMLRRLVPGRSR